MKWLALLMLLPGCATVPRTDAPLTVNEVWARHHELDGKMVRVEGVVVNCYGMGCSLQETAESDSRWLAVGTSRTFDSAVQGYLGKRIVVEARLNAECLHADADTKAERLNAQIVICSDRASMLIDPKLIVPLR